MLNELIKRLVKEKRSLTGKYNLADQDRRIDLVEEINNLHIAQRIINKYDSNTNEIEIPQEHIKRRSVGCYDVKLPDGMTIDSVKTTSDRALDR